MSVGHSLVLIYFIYIEIFVGYSRKKTPETESPNGQPAADCASQELICCSVGALSTD